MIIFAVLLLWGWQSHQYIQETRIQERSEFHPDDGGVRQLETASFQSREYVRINRRSNIEGN